MGIAALKESLRDVPGIHGLTMQHIAGRDNYQLDGKIISLDPRSTSSQIESAIRTAASSTDVVLMPVGPPAEPASQGEAAETPSPASASLLPANAIQATKETPMPTGFAESIKAMMNEARAGVEKARTDGLATVQTAVGKLNQAKAATEKVAGTMAKTIEDEAASVMSELGQISNDL